MSKVIEYEPGDWSVVELNDGRHVMISVGATTLWVHVRRRRPLIQPRWLPRGSRRLTTALARLVSAKTLLTATNLRPLRGPDGQPLEAGKRLLENLTSGLETCADLAEAQEFASQVERQSLGLRQCSQCRQTKDLAFFALDDARPSGHSEVCATCDQSGAWEAVQQRRAALAALAPEERQRRFIERGRELALVKELSPESQFPAEYQGIRLDEDEREFVANYLETWLGNIPPDMRALLNYLYVADALFSYANSALAQANRKKLPDLARAACQTAEKGMMVAKDECCFVYEFARCLDSAGFDRALDYYRLFLERSARDPGVRGSSAAHGDYFKRALQHARERLQEGRPAVGPDRS